MKFFCLNEVAGKKCTKNRRLGVYDGTWKVKLDDVEDEDDVDVLKVHVKQVFQGAVDPIAQIDNLWLIDYSNVFTVERLIRWV
jgi:hypothetical protein